MRPVEGAAGGGVAGAVVAQHGAIAVLDLDRRVRQHHGLHPAFERDLGGRECGLRGAPRRQARRTRRRTVSARAAATATAISAVSCSAASSQCGVGLADSPAGGCASASARSSAETRAAWAASTASTSRSRKRRRSEAGPRNSPSMAGTSQTTRRWSAKAAAEPTGSRSIRHLRERRVSSPPAARCRCRGSRGRGRRRPRRTPPTTAAMRGPRRGRRSAFREGDLVELGAAQPAARRRNEIASSTLVLPAPLGPVSTTRLADVAMAGGAVVAEIGEASGGGYGRQSVTTSAS